MRNGNVTDVCTYETPCGSCAAKYPSGGGGHQHIAGQVGLFTARAGWSAHALLRREALAVNSAAEAVPSMLPEVRQCGTSWQTWCG